jgi:hypothetical protein
MEGNKMGTGFQVGVEEVGIIEDEVSEEEGEEEDVRF